MSASLRVGLIGLGKIGRVHWNHSKLISGIQVTAIAEIMSLAGEEFPPEIRMVEDWTEIVEDPEIDAVVISLPHVLHARCAEAALRNGKHVFLEKPLATSLQDAQELVECARATDRTLMVNMTHRFYPPLQRARQLLTDGVIGDVISVRDFAMEIVDRAEFPGWFFDPVVAGGGVVITSCIHLLDRVCWLLSEPLSFVGGSSRRLMPESNVEDCAEILCETPSGIPVAIGSFFFTGPKMFDDGLTIFGTKGKMTIHAWSHLEWNLYDGEKLREDGYDPSIPAKARPEVGHRAALSEFVSAIREQRVPEAEAGTVMDAQEVVERFYHSVKENRLADITPK